MYRLSQCRSLQQPSKNSAATDNGNEATATDNGSEAPATVQDFEELVVEAYKLANGSQAPSESPVSPCEDCARKQLTVSPVINKQGIVIEVPVFQPFSHNVFRISDEVQEHLERRLKYSTPEVAQATAELKRALTGKKTRRLKEGLLRRLGAPDAREVQPAEYVDLLNVLADVFLPCKPRFKFEFLTDEDESTYADCLIIIEHSESMYARIRLNATAHDAELSPPAQYGDVLNAASMCRIGSLLHEICHAILAMNFCPSCDDKRIGRTQFKGHGFAWQRVACWMEFAALHAFGLPVSLCRFEGIRFHWDDLEQLPNLEEMASWELRDW